VGTLREEVVPLRACEVAVGDAAGGVFPDGRIEVPDHAGAVVEDRDCTLAVGEGVAPAACVGARKGRADEPPGGDVPEPDPAVAAGGDELAAVREVGNAGDYPVLSREGVAHGAAGRCVRKVHGAGEVAGGDRL